MAEKTHWKKVASDPNYLGEADFQEGEEKVLTIDHVNGSETVTTAEGKSKKAVLHFREAGIKPMILNVAKSKSIEKVAGSAYIEDWPGVQIQLYIEHGIKAFGEIVSAVRVRPFKPRIAAAKPTIPPCADCGGEIKPSAGKGADWIAQYTAKKYGRPLCDVCAKKAADAKAAAEAKEEQTPPAVAEEPETEEKLPWDNNEEAL